MLIASTQLRDFFGLQLPQVPSEFTARMVTMAQRASTWSPPALAFGASALGMMILLRDSFRCRCLPPSCSWSRGTWVTPDFVEEGRVHILQDKPIPPYVSIFKIRGPFLFGSTDKLADVTTPLDLLPPIVILRLRYMTAIDGTGLRAFEDLAERLRASGRTLLLCGAREQPAAVMRQAYFYDHIGELNLCPNIAVALARAAEIHSQRAA